jgi:hypothetical protein
MRKAAGADHPKKLLIEFGDNHGVSVTAVSDGGGPMGMGGKEKTTMYASWDEAKNYLDTVAPGGAPGAAGPGDAEPDVPGPDEGPEESAEGEPPTGDAPPPQLTRAAVAAPPPAARGAGIQTTAAPPARRRPPFLG